MQRDDLEPHENVWQDTAAIVAIRLVEEKAANRSLRRELEYVTRSLILTMVCALLLFVLAIVGWLT